MCGACGVVPGGKKELELRMVDEGPGSGGEELATDGRARGSAATSDRHQPGVTGAPHTGPAGPTLTGNGCIATLRRLLAHA